MATKTRKVSMRRIGTAMLEQVANLDAKSMSAETAQKLLQLRFDASHQRRVDRLLEKARAGNLTPDEQSDLDEYIHVGDLLAILQSRARQALKLSSHNS